MKKYKKSIAYFLTLIFLTPMLWSCSRVNESRIKEDTNSYREMAKSIVETHKLFNEINTNSPDFRTFDYGEISQEDVDYYASILGYDDGEFDVELVNAILEKYIDVLDHGYEQVIEDYDLSEFTKLSMVDIAEGRWIDDLESHPNFQNLNLTEKELLSLANAFAQELEERGTVTGQATGAFFGMIIGAWLCNVWCVLGGAIIGGIIGSFSDKT